MNTTTTTTPTRTERFDAAVKATRKAGVKVYRNVTGCCRSCLGAEADAKVEGSVWHYGGQGGRVVARGGEFIALANYYRRTDKVADFIYFNFDDVENAKVFAANLREQGLALDWDGTEFKCVGVGGIRTYTMADFDADA